MNDLRKLILSKLPFYSTVLEILRKGELQLDKRDFLIGKFKKILRSTDLPPSFLKSFFFALFHDLFHFVKGSESSLACFYHAFRRFLCFLAEHIYNYDYIQVDPVYDSPSGIGIDYSQFMAPSTDRWHRPRVGQTKLLAKLKLTQQEASLKAGRLGKWWSSYFAFKPDEGLVFLAITCIICQI